MLEAGGGPALAGRSRWSHPYGNQLCSGLLLVSGDPCCSTDFLDILACGWPVQLNLWPRATLAVLIRELDASDPELRQQLEPVRQLRRRFWFSFAIGVASVTTLVIWIKDY
jgi:hypothetical protein